MSKDEIHELLEIAKALEEIERDHEIIFQSISNEFQL